MSASPRPQQHRRTSSTVSLGKAAAGAGAHRVKAGKTHTVGKHNRNRSLKDLTKLTKLAAGEDAGSVRPAQMSRTSSNPGQTPSTVASVKRNKSDVTLSRLGSKAHIKKNQSAVSLRRNESSTKLKRNSRPTTPRGPKGDEDTAQKYVQPAFTIDADDDEEQEDEWTEESASVSPVVTRHGSMKGQRPNVQTNGVKPDNTSPLKHDAKVESPTTPVVDAQKPLQRQPSQYGSTSSLLPDPTAITSRLLRRTSSQQLAPKLSTISAGGSSGTQSPSQGESNGHMTISQTFSSTASESVQPSMPSEGVSRFLDPGAASSSGRNTFSSPLQTAMGQMRAQGARTRSPSPNPEADKLKRAQTAAAMSWDLRGERQGETPVKITGEHKDADKRTWTIDSSNYRRAGGNTQAKMDLWRTQSHVEPNAQPPAPLMQSKNSHGTEARRHMGADERKIQQAEVAEAELGYVRMYRSPAIESCERLRVVRKRKEKSRKRTSMENGNGTHTGGVSAARRRSKREDRERPTSSQDTPSGTPGSLGTTVAGSAGTSGRRNVRFSVGGDAHEEPLDDVTEEARLASMLRGLWYGGEGDAASVD